MGYVNTRKAVALLGVHPSTLRRWANDGRIEHIRSPGNRRLYNVQEFLQRSTDVAVVCYCRVSSDAQRDDLQGQVAILRSRYPDAEIIADIGGGLNWKRKGLLALLERLHGGEKLRIVVAHKDRLARFGFEVIEWLAKQNGGEVVVQNGTDHSPERELTEDILSILHTFSCRLYGLRKYRNKIKKDTTLSDKPSKADD